MSLIPGKIVLKSSTSKTLSERFGELAKKSTVENIRDKKRQESTASIKNKRLAANMAKRLGDSFEEAPSPGRKPVKTRLGLSLAKRLGNQGRRGGGQRQQASTGSVTTRTGGLTRGSFRGRRGTRGRGGFSQRGVSRGGRGGLNNQVTKRGKSTIGGRGAARRGVATRGAGGRGRGARGRGARGRGARGRGAATGKTVTQEQLDKELDQYMSKTKSALNAELDQYMSAVSK